ncbi:trimeric intracellular cation channel family protein [Azonexus sp. IMCC34842]|uniref:trimeric intracellular cation channel family protein n=1 Tax=Azonexaceae TaxID=2008795 RepID=UPI001CF8262A|nr:trimeric intracellular cation channel family protein [Dechloromonas denitrificans]UCV05101.1 trimeric intracellular cation channel family protein [Dechloromonas denitrificans]
MNIEPLLIAIEVAATIAFALSGLIEATRKRMDVIGVFSVTFVSAFGGGTLRDVLLDRRPLFWVQHQEYVWLVLALTLTAPLLLQARRHQLVDKLTEVADAFGLGLFAISGASLALVAGMPAIIAVLMGAITAVFGGVLRDVLCNEIPKVFHDHRPYTLCIFIGCPVFLGLHALDVAPQISTGAGICIITGLRLLAVARGWKIPAWPPQKMH